MQHEMSADELLCNMRGLSPSVHPSVRACVRACGGTGRLMIMMGNQLRSDRARHPTRFKPRCQAHFLW